LTNLHPPEELLIHLHDHAGDYFEDLRGDTVRVETTAVEIRPRSRIYRLRLTGTRGTHGVFVKEPNLGAASALEGATVLPARPRLVQPADPAERYQAEHASLIRVEAALKGTDVRFGVVRPLDFIASRSAIVAAELREPSLRDLLTGHTRLHLYRRSTDLAPAFEHAGAWLRCYHALDAPWAIERHATRRALLDFAEAVGAYLGEVQADEKFFREAISTLAHAASAALPDELELAVGHGDFATRNMLVGAAGRVYVTDMAMRWRTARYEDLAYFMVALRTPRAQALAGGGLFSEASLTAWEHSLLMGYFPDETPPSKAIRIYQLVMLLDKWASQREALWMPGARRVLRIEWLLREHLLRKEAVRLLNAM
jgi:hypothetical protein